jgi:pyruvyltransferase
MAYSYLFLLYPPHVGRAQRHSSARRTRAHTRPDALRRLVAEYRIHDRVLEDAEGRVPVRWWSRADNFGDLLSPWLVSRMTGREVVLAEPDEPHYLAIGSILNLTTAASTVWGSGAFGPENGPRFCDEASYTAVRGPLSRSRLLVREIPCPEVYGDPALLAPAYFAPSVPRTHQVGIVTRWSERRWHEADVAPDVRLIHLGTSDVEGVIEAMLSCRRIVSGSLHGLVIADAYGIPSAWVQSPTAYGGPYKFFDYFAAVEKMRTPQEFDTRERVTAARLRRELSFDRRPIRFDHRALLDACPFVERVGADRPVAKPREAVAG